MSGYPRTSSFSNSGRIMTNNDCGRNVTSIMTASAFFTFCRFPQQRIVAPTPNVRCQRHCAMTTALLLKGDVRGLPDTSFVSVYPRTSSFSNSCRIMTYNDSGRSVTSIMTASAFLTFCRFPQQRIVAPTPNIRCQNDCAITMALLLKGDVRG